LAADPDEQVREAQAVVPERERLVTPRRDLGIDHRDRTVAEVHRHQTRRQADLRRRDRAAEAQRGPDARGTRRSSSLVSTWFVSESQCLAYLPSHNRDSTISDTGGADR